MEIVSGFRVPNSNFGVKEFSGRGTLNYELAVLKLNF
jgi:hypothetical protein